MERRTVGRQADRARGSALIETSYEDETGRWWTVLVPPGETQPEMGIPVGPPDVREAFPNLPESIAVRLHNELNKRRLFRRRDIQGHGARQLQAALQAAYRLDTAAITSVYRTG